MSLDRSLKSAGSLTPHRNVLSRAERVGKLTEKGKFDMQASDPLGLPKVGNRKIAAAAKAPKKEAAAAGAAPVAGAPGAAPAAGAAAGKAGAPAAKAAAPAGDKGKGKK